MAEIALYNYFRSSTSYRVRIALHHKSIPFDYKPVHLLKGEQHLPAYRNINPLGELPSLVHDGNVIAQSLAIMEYLDEAFPETPRLYPRDLVTKAQVRQFSENINAFIHPVNNLKVLKRLEEKHGYGNAEKEQWIQHWTVMGFETLEKMLVQHSGTYAFGGEITAADACLIPAVYSAQRFNVSLSNFPNVARVNEAALKLPAFQKAHPGRQIDTPDELKIV